MTYLRAFSKMTWKKVVFIAVAIGLVIGSSFFFTKWLRTEKVAFSKLEQIIQQEEGTSMTLKEYANGKLILQTPDTSYEAQVRPHSDLVEQLVKDNSISYIYNDSSNSSSIIFSIIILLVIIGVILQRKGKIGIGASSMKNSASKASPLPNITMDNIGGLPTEMKEEVLQTLEIVKHPERSKEIGIHAPKGILLYGPPGTGKTLLAQAIANEIGATFYATSGAEFTELFVGVGASRVRTLFQNARKQSPAVIFIDEVDALAAKRKAHGGEETEKTLTELLVQLDGVKSNEGILFIAATNRKDLLDDAFLRPGRIDFTFHVPLPDTVGRKEIIHIHSKGKRLAADVFASLDQLAESTSGFSGAELRSLFDTASRRAIREQREKIEKSDLDFAIDRTILGSTSRSLNDDQTKRRVAIHEAGHALVAALTKPNSVRKATIIPRGEALGYVAPFQKEVHLATHSELLDQVSMILAGGVAERLYLGEHSIGVGGDVQQAKNILERMVDTGLLEEGFMLTFDKTSKEQKMQQLFERAIQKTEQLIQNHAPQFEQLVERLFHKETLDGEEVQKIVASKFEVVM